MQLKVASERLGSTAGHHRGFYTRQKYTEYTDKLQVGIENFKQFVQSWKWGLVAEILFVPAVLMHLKGKLQMVHLSACSV